MDYVNGCGDITLSLSVHLTAIGRSLAVWIGSYLLFATAGPAFPEQYKHDDGGKAVHEAVRRGNTMISDMKRYLWSEV